MQRLIAALILCVMVAVMPAAAQANPKYASLVIDAETGAVLSESNADKALHPASLTKVMTLLLLFEAMESGRVRPNDKILISQKAASESPSKIGLPAGSSIRVEDAILALVTKSANDISTAIGEHLAGSEARFAERMTYRAQTIGMRSTRFRNAHGLHHPQQITTARDMATLARYVITRYPNYYRYFSTKQFTYRGKTYTNHNRLMNTYQGMDGFKTGFINASGFNLIASAKRGDRRLIGVVFGGRSWQTRNDHMAEILNTAFATRGRAQQQYASAVSPRQTSAPVAAAMRPALPPAPPKPAEIAQAQQAAPMGQAFTSLEALSNNDLQIAVAPAPREVDVTGEAIKSVRTAINQGEYSELTGEGDYDAVTTRRIETGLLAAAVYKGEAQHVAAARLQPGAERNLAAQIQNRAQEQQAQAVQPAAFHGQQITPPQGANTESSWSIQIGAYTSRVATDDALRRAIAKLPSELSHARPVVVPLTTGEGTLFRGRLGNFSQAQAANACRYFRDCLPLAPR